MQIKNIYSPGKIPSEQEAEFFEVLHQNKNIKIERIISKGHITDKNKWYNQKTDEWVLLIQGQAKIEFEENKIIELKSGDYILIPAGKKHKVIYTSKNPYCVWLAIHTKAE
ncbi:MAG: cupin domain-containing protein [Bacteroidota bacterium]